MAPHRAERDKAEHGDRLLEVVNRHRVPVGLIVVAVTLAPNLVSIPYVNRYDVWSAVGVFTVLVAALYFDASRRVFLALTFAGIVAVAAVAVLAGHRGEGEGASSEILPRVAPTPQITDVGGRPVTMVRAFGHRWVLHAAGSIDRLDADGGGRPVKLHVKGPAAAITPCSGGLIVTHDHGKVARLDPVSGRQLVDYPYGRDSGPIACGDGYVFVAKPTDGTVVQLDARSLEYVDAFPLVTTVTSLTFGDHVVWVLDRRAGEVVGVATETKEKLGPFRIGSDAAQILYAGERYLWVLYRRTSCLTRLDLARRREVRPAIALGPFAWEMRRAAGLILVADYADGSVLKVDVASARPLGRVLIVRDGRLTAVDAHSDRLIGLDSEHGKVLGLGPEVEARRQRPVYQGGRDCR